ncbi:kinase-like protein [Lepidopterella palustris CBS 459.81]|uniref:Kinase-like protein n=1 Tax=Lepidopterella palustris CBS 459.81 TaxID=1314670 RepID=A0A8E2DXT9_9PEZI|nr:kinase-like protein [Lepidopterella palustris CBS 459.81]
MDSSDNRHTQINMFALTDAQSLVQTEGLHGSRSHDAPNKKRAPPEDAWTEAKIPRSATKNSLRVKWESPWQKYDKVYDIELGGSVEVAIGKVPPFKLVHVRAFSKPVAEKTLHMFRQVQHRNIVAALEAFATDDSLYIVLEHMPVSLEWIVRSPAYPNEGQLAAILGQILNGVAYIAAEGFQHGSLCCANILLKTNGDVKIANQECCHVMSQPKGGSCDVRALSFITMELMQKYVKEDGAIGVDDLRRWYSNSDAVGFLSATTSVESAEELLKHPLLKRPWQKESLLGIISLAQVCIRGRYKYTPRE